MAPNITAIFRKVLQSLTATTTNHANSKEARQCSDLVEMGSSQDTKLALALIQTTRALTTLCYSVCIG